MFERMWVEDNGSYLDPKSLLGASGPTVAPRLAMANFFRPGTRVRLVQDHKDAGGLQFQQGQLATVHGHMDGTSLVHFDGYDDLREELRVQPAAFGTADQAPWLAVVPTELLEPV